MFAIPECELPGIYAFRFSDGAMYIGMAKNLKKRLQSHKYRVLHKKEPMKLQDAFNRCGDPAVMILEALPRDCTLYELMGQETLHISDAIARGEMLLNFETHLRNVTRDQDEAVLAHIKDQNLKKEMEELIKYRSSPISQ